ncbi:AI-2E family transporter [Methyloferula stellata]|uniref:AI-2E family transporter n=1 Tax=Methyloferula stellata TaxID=876270 RepID=UPI001376223F|nr:AI-2E family transporter [Methyloferula stellata]
MPTSEADSPLTVKSPFNGARADLGRRAPATDTIIIIVAVIAGLYFGHDVLVPITLAVLLSFVLAPITGIFEKLFLGRVASVLLAVTLAVAILIGLGTIIGKQVAQLAGNLPAYQFVISKKLQTLRSSDLGKGVMEKAANAIEGLDSNLNKPAAAPAEPNASQSNLPRSPVDAYIPVEVHTPAPGPVQILESVIAALLPPLATVGVVVIFVVFILLQRQDLRDRFIGLTGAHDLHRTTRALDDAAYRLSRYFLALTAINAAFGVVITIGLAFIGVPNPILWGIAGGVLRFIPYIGAIIAVAFPLALAAAVDPGWSMVIETALLFLIVEGVMGQVIEPQLFGHTTGMSPLAIIIAAAFWTLIWGPAGLLLSTPITACLVVLGRHVENLNFIELILGDKPGLSPVQSFYQRVLAGDPDEVAFQAEGLLKNMSLLDYYEDVALPALALAQVDATRGVLDSNRQAEVCAAIEHVVDDLSDHVVIAESRAEVTIPPAADSAQPRDVLQDNATAGSVMCLAGQSLLDKAACDISGQVLAESNIPSRIEGPSALTTSGIFGLNADGAKAICIFYMDHRSKAAIRYSVRRLRKKFPGMPIAVCLWGATDLASMVEVAKADANLGSLREVIDFCENAMHPVEITIPTRSPPIEAAFTQG